MYDAYWAGLLDPTTDESLHLVCRGIRRQQDNPERKRLPITIDLLRTLKSQLCFTNYSLLEQRMLWSSFTISFYAFLRSSECLSLTWSDITVTETGIVIVLCQSKTDPFRRGQSIYIYQTMTSTCPVRALQLYAGMVSPKPPNSYALSAGTFKPLTGPKFTEVVRQLLTQAGQDPVNYVLQSFHIGAATTVAAAGFPSWSIKALGRWSSDAYLTYVCCPHSVIASVPRILSSASVTNCPTWSPDNWPSGILTTMLDTLHSVTHPWCIISYFICVIRTQIIAFIDVMMSSNLI